MDINTRHAQGVTVNSYFLFLLDLNSSKRVLRTLALEVEGEGGATGVVATGVGAAKYWLLLRESPGGARTGCSSLRG
jgi:hypothetical protein